MGGFNVSWSYVIRCKGSVMTCQCNKMSECILHYGNVMLQVSPLLSLAAELIRQFGSHADVVVSVARKTDAALWPALFSAVGTPSALLDSLVEKGALASASCCLLVIDR